MPFTVEHLSEKKLTVPDAAYGRVSGNYLLLDTRYLAMTPMPSTPIFSTPMFFSPMPSLLSGFSDPLGVHLMGEHQRRYECIKAWRDMQRNPHFTKVPTKWRKEFGRKKKKTEPSRREF